MGKEDRSTNRFPVGDSLCHARDKMKSVCFKLTFQPIYKEKALYAVKYIKVQQG